jgi:hypothetical protein
VGAGQAAMPRAGDLAEAAIMSNSHEARKTIWQRTKGFDESPS